jgi:hypothetical protein
MINGDLSELFKEQLNATLVHLAPTLQFRMVCMLVSLFLTSMYINFHDEAMIITTKNLTITTKYIKIYKIDGIRRAVFS